MRRPVAAGIAAWLAVVGLATLAGPSVPAPLLAASVLAPLAAFGMLWVRSRALRAWALGLDLRPLTWVHVWRLVAGPGLLLLYGEGRLPWRLGLAHGLLALVLAVTTPLVARWAGAATIGRLAALFAWHGAGAVSLVALAITALRLAGQGDERVAVLTTFPWSLLPSFVGPAAFLTHAVALAIVWERPLAPTPLTR